jgi:hypothetical protein
VAKEVIMVMGVQRSGTKVLFNTLASDPTLVGFNESVDDAIYDRYRLRPLPQITHVLNAAPGTVLLKPISETSDRTLEEIAAEYEAYDLRVVWIYRDPVNVLYSMHRKGWLPPTQIDASVHVLDWERRNRLALRFHAQNPTRTAVVRYEDCCTDPRVFRDLNAWLGVTGASLFRTDSDGGRKNVARKAQEKIDAVVGLTLLALNDARTFKSRTLSRWKQSFRETFSETRKKRVRARAGLLQQKNFFSRDAILSSAPLRVPSEVEGLQFWLDVSANEPGADGRIANFRESGPHRMMAGSDAHRPFHMFVNGKAALFFPAEKHAERRPGGSGILRFGAGADWSFIFDGSPVAIFAVFKPHFPRAASTGPQRAIVFRVGARRETAPAFLFEWNERWTSSKGMFVSGQSTTEIIAATPLGGHRRQQWRVNYLEYGGASDESSSILGEVAENTRISRPPKRAEKPAAGMDCDLQLGGNQGEGDSLFYGAVAELLIFCRALDPNEQRGITRYLKEKYRL